MTTFLHCHLTRFLFLFLSLAAFCLVMVKPCEATPHFSAQTGWSCSRCHESPQGGAGLTSEGYSFRAKGYVVDAKPANWRGLIELIAGFIHIVVAVVWFGAIFYIHIFVGPRSLTTGVPKGERIMGLGSIVIVGLTGTVLTWLRISELRELWTTTFGIVLLVKISAFLCMVAVAVITTTYVHRTLSKAGESASQGTTATDGKEGGAAQVAYQGQLYDVSVSKLWKDGVHMGRHRAGGDLTEAMSGAPHGPEVLERLPKLGPVQATEAAKPPFAHRLLVKMAYTVLGFMLVILFCLAYWNWGPPLAHARQPWTNEQAAACLGCHEKATPGIYADWVRSTHAKNKVSCLNCHSAEANDPDVVQSHLSQYARKDSKWGDAKYRTAISAVVTPKDCSRCHPDIVEQYSMSKHANTQKIMWQIDPWLNHGLNSEFERSNGCYHCHGTILNLDKNGKLDPLTWPNVGVGRVNLDGSLGSCTSCHTRHRFSLAEARKPDTCGQCHLGPDHPQLEIWNESKHGAIYRSEGFKWNFEAAPDTWTPGVDYRTPTCAACHMSGSGKVQTTHDVTERLSWELQAPLTIRPQDFKPFPAKTNWQDERKKMQMICLQCHGKVWVDGHYAQMDGAVELYNNTYFKPAHAKLNELYKKVLLPEDALFKSPLWVEFYELWHHEGRRARMGSAMMAPDYAWWHGFYECKKRYVKFMREADELIKHNKKAYVAPHFPGSTGSIIRPKKLFKD